MTRTRTYVVVSPYELYRCVLTLRGFRIKNYGELDRGILLLLMPGYYEDDVVFLEYIDEL